MLNRTSYFLIISFLLTIASCSNNDKSVLASDAKVNNETKTENSTSFEKIKDGSHIQWRASHLGGIDPRQGKVYCKEGSVSVNNNRVSHIYFSIDMDNLTVEDLPEEGIRELGEHLKSKDFFDVANHPLSTFELTKLVSQKGEYNSKVTGNLTILGIVKSISFFANIRIKKDEVRLRSEAFVIDRSDWGITYNAKGTAVVPLDYLISDDIGFTVDISITK